jgi:hypothetical protein
MQCIWCSKRTTDRDLEHIFPAALGCPDHMTLSGNVVCRRCNNKLSKLDGAVCDEFDLLAYFSGVPRRGGKPPHILNRGNLIATVEPSGPKVSINMAPNPSPSHIKQQLGRYGGSQRNVNAKIAISGELASVSGQVPFGQGRNFVRGLLKIAFSCFTYHLGPEAASSKRFDPVREFVIHSKGARRVLVTKGDDSQFLLASYPPWIGQDGNCCVEFRIATLHFLVDLSPEENKLLELRQKAEDLFGSDGFFVLPTPGL